MWYKNTSTKQNINRNQIVWLLDLQLRYLSCKFSGIFNSIEVNSYMHYFGLFYFLMKLNHHVLKNFVNWQFIKNESGVIFNWSQSGIGRHTFAIVSCHSLSFETQNDDDVEGLGQDVLWADRSVALGLTTNNASSSQ